MTVWFTSDLHIGDPWTTKMRYCQDDVDKHDNWLASRWDATVAPDDTVWLLGDVAVGPTRQRFSEWLTARPGTKHLILGNHDEGYADYQWLWFGFTSVQRGKVLHLGEGVHAHLSHYPTAKDRPRGMTGLHGHTHRRVKATRDDDRTPLIHVGWEAWRRLIPQDELIDLISEMKERDI